MIRSLILATLVLLTGCANLQKPVSAEDYIQSAKAQVSAAYKTIGDLKASGSITQDQGKSYFARVEAVEKQVAVAEAAFKGGADVTNVNSMLQLSLRLLLVIQTELNARSPK